MPARIPTKRLLFELQRVAKAVGEPPSAHDFQEHGEIDKGVITNRFASWSAARRAAGLQGEIIPWERRKTPERVLLDDLRGLAREIGKIPAAADMEEHGGRSSTTYQRRFGSWQAAREKAGFPDENVFKIQSDTLLSALRDFADVLGRTPTQNEMKRDGPHSAQVYNNRFGTYNSAVLAAGLEPNHEPDVVVHKTTQLYGSNWPEQRRKALERDGWECVVCGTTQEQHEQQRGQSLHVHHITPSREFNPPEEGNYLENLATLCAYCHGEYERFPEKLARDRR